MFQSSRALPPEKINLFHDISTQIDTCENVESSDKRKAWSS